MVLSKQINGCRLSSGAHRRESTRKAPSGRLILTTASKSESVPGLLNEEDIAAMAKEIFTDDPVMKEKLGNWTSAMAKLDAAKLAASKMESEFEEMAREAALDDQKGEQERKRLAQQKLADAEVLAAEKLLMAAEIESSRAQMERDRLRSSIDADAGRIESGKAAAAALVGGLLASLPWFLLGGSPEPSGVTSALSLLSALAESAIFGVTYRYAVASQPSSSHLKSGAVTAFALVRAGAVADLLQQTSGSGPFSIEEVIGPAALYAGQSVLLFGFAAAAIEAAMSRGLISRIDGQRD
jgi:hypothetical protein